jgi:glycosyltransferase involved in cell wall biosynthesis
MKGLSPIVFLNSNPSNTDEQGKGVRNSDTLIIIPAFNEAWNITHLIKEIKAEGNFDILVIDDASSDGTGKLAKKTNLAHVISLPHNLGIGGSVQTGFKFANIHGYKYIVQVDGDGQHKVNEISRLLKLIKLDKADVVVGSRFNKKHRGYRSSSLRRVGIKVFEILGILMIKQRIKDSTSGFRAYNRETIKFLSKFYPVDYPEPEAIILLGKNGFRISEVFTKMNPRKGGKSSLNKRGIFYMLKVSLGMIMTYIRPKSA